MPPVETQQKYNRLKDLLIQMSHVIVAFSGGVDSSLLMKIVSDVLPGRVLAVTAESPTSATHELNAAKMFADSVHVEHLIIHSKEMDLPEFKANNPDRCYVCKKHRFAAILAVAQSRDIEVVLDGENADDAADYRPGSRAARELGVRSPLKEVGLKKSEVRELSGQLGLHTWDMPAYACLASRIPYNQEITPEKLRRVDRAEEYIRKLLNIRQVRVRHYGSTAKIEVEPTVVSRIVDPDVRTSIIDYFKKLGFKHVTLDLEGYTMGALNKDLKLSVQDRPR